MARVYGSYLTQGTLLSLHNRPYRMNSSMAILRVGVGWPVTGSLNTRLYRRVSSGGYKVAP